MSGTARFALLAALLLVSTASLGDAGGDTQTLAKQAQNPIANLISVPVQSNTNFGDVVSPDGGPDWSIRVQVLLPK